MTTELPTTKKRGFAAMDPARQREIASKGGKASHEQGTGYQWDYVTSVEAGRKGGLATAAKRAKTLAPIDAVICKGCLVELTVHNRGQWAASKHCIDCEDRALKAAIAEDQ